MSNPSLTNVDETKLIQLINFAVDEGLDKPYYCVQLIQFNQNADATFAISPQLSKLRLAWSLIRCGVEYHYGRFHHKVGNAEIDTDLSSMLSIILVDLTNEEKIA